MYGRKQLWCELMYWILHGAWFTSKTIFLRVKLTNFHFYIVSFSLSFIKVNDSTKFLFPKSHVIVDVFMGRSVYGCLQRITCPLIQYFLHIFRTYWVNSRVKRCSCWSFQLFKLVEFKMNPPESWPVVTFGCNRIRIKLQFSTLLIDILKNV